MPPAKLPKVYVLTEADFRAIMNLHTAANLIATGVPPAYTNTPKGPLHSLVDAVGGVLLSAQESDVLSQSREAVEVIARAADKLDSHLESGTKEMRAFAGALSGELTALQARLNTTPTMSPPPPRSR